MLARVLLFLKLVLATAPVRGLLVVEAPAEAR